MRADMLRGLLDGRPRPLPEGKRVEEAEGVDRPHLDLGRGRHGNGMVGSRLGAAATAELVREVAASISQARGA